MVSGCPLLHLVHQLVNYWSDQGACLDSDEWVSTPPSWYDPCIGLVGPGGISGLGQDGVHSSISDKWVSTPPSWSDHLHHYQLDQGHGCTQMSGYPLLHPGLTRTGLVRPGGIFGLRQVGVHSSILV